MLKTRNMNVSIDIRSAIEASPSGVGMFSSNLISQLIKNNQFNYSLFATGYKIKLQSRFLSSSPAGGDPQSINHNFINYPNKLINILLKTKLLNLDRLFPTTDLYYLPNPNFINTKKSIITTFHDLSFHHFPEFFSLKQQLWHKAVNPQGLANKSAHLIAVSNYTKTDLMKTWRIREEKITVINPIIAADFKPQSEEIKKQIRQKYNLKNPYILFLGSLEPRKNIPSLVEAFELITDDVDLVLAGGFGHQQKELTHQINCSPKKDRIKIIGYVPGVDKPALYSAAELFVYPSFFEGFGMPSLEAAACGTAVITSNNSALRETAIDFAYMIDPYNVRDLADAIHTILNSNKIKQSLISAGTKSAQHFQAQNQAGILENVFRFLIGS